MPRVLVDTNVWVSALLNPHGFPARVLEALETDQFEPILSEPLLEELLDVLSRPRLIKKYHLEPYDIAELAALLEEKAIKVAPSGKLHLCRDPRDDIVLETALLGNANYAVSRDDDLKRDLELIQKMEEQGVKVVSVSQFLSFFEENAPQNE
ncbi:MAG: putative toxin-antitoxin system toxin component, PIN family [candidate division KSB1 bacterium]|nr:putative toxin-antitoxin system toxin component, PIN family [candidate division KSB1 bacterium]MDZ7300890.1 putative toxin-antitoxin system toxin component, PIN family [candidate division KSB1 bacterium]MDZ7309840.1 putative toxin-antitoxin system toxin component, PIN family [candidate division KSB1 bacterium]